MVRRRSSAENAVPLWKASAPERSDASAEGRCSSVAVMVILLLSISASCMKMVVQGLREASHMTWRAIVPDFSGPMSKLLQVKRVSCA